jgi:hypothetical protein
VLQTIFSVSRGGLSLTIIFSIHLIQGWQISGMRAKVGTHKILDGT